MHFQKLTGAVCAGLSFSFAAVLASSSGCSSSNDTGGQHLGADSGTHSDSGGGDSTGPSCGGSSTLADESDFAGCTGCTFPSTATATTCTPSTTVNACCAWLAPPTAPLARATGLHYYSATSDTTVDFSCNSGPVPGAEAGAPQMTTLSGFVKIFASPTGADTTGVQVQAFMVDTATGALGAQVGSTYVTSATDMSETNDWLNACTTTNCTFRKYTITNVPTETQLVIKTSNSGAGTWADLYDYNIYFANDSTCANTGDPTVTAPGGGPCVSSKTATPWTTNYDVTAVQEGDVQTVAVTVGATINPSLGAIAGEVHDCGDIRISGADVNTDQNVTLYYFDGNEGNPLPDSSSTSTSALGLFGGLNFAVGTPIRVSAIGTVGGQDTLLGTAVVQTYAGPSVSAISFRGRRQYQVP